MIAALASHHPFQFYVGIASRRSLDSRSKLAERTIPAQTGEAEETAEERRGGDRSSGICGGRPRPRQRAGSSHTHAPHASPKSLHSLPTYLRVCATKSEQMQVLRIQHEHHIFSPSSPEKRLCLTTSCASLRPTVASSNNISGPSPLSELAVILYWANCNEDRGRRH